MIYYNIYIYISSFLCIPICLLSTLLRDGILLPRIVSMHCSTVARSFVLLGRRRLIVSSLLRVRPSFRSPSLNIVNFRRRLPSRFLTFGN